MSYAHELKAYQASNHMPESTASESGPSHDIKINFGDIGAGLGGIAIAFGLGLALSRYQTKRQKSAH